MKTTSRSLIAAFAVALAGWSHSALAADCLQGTNASGTCTVPAGVTEMTVHAIGGGGGGGRDFNTGGNAALGGGGGSYCGGTFTVTPGDDISVTVGAAGAGAVNVSGGGSGGQSSVSWGGQLRVAANGGNGGESAAGFDAGLGGTVDACPTSSKFAGGSGGAEGSSVGGGGGGAAGSTAAGSNGEAGNAGGAGGAGGAGSPAGGSGGAGGDSGLAGGVGGTPGAGGGGSGNRANSSVNNYGGNGAAGVVVLSFNLPPVANNDAYSTPQNAVLTVTQPGLKGNDFDPEGNIFLVESATAAAHGQLSWVPDGEFTYTPDTNFAGVDSFTYTLRDSDGALSTPATVQITVTSTNRPPNALDDAYSTPEGTPLNVLRAKGVLANDTDPDGDHLTITATTNPGNGQLFPGSDGAFIYQPNTGFTGNDSFAYTVSDGRDTDEAAVVITVTAINDPPVAQDDLYNVNQDALLKVAAPGILANDSDPEGHVLAVTLVTAPANGDMGLIAGGGFFYKPHANFTGQDTFTYTVSDGDLDSNEATVTIQVNAVNHPPVANPDTYTTPQDTILTIRAPGLLGNDTDPDGDTLRLGSVLGPALHGFVFPAIDGSFTYTPNPGFSGTDRFTYAVDDGKERAVGEVTITVTPNLPPVANDDSYATPQDTLLTVAAPGVIGNDSDPEGHALSVTVVNNPANGVLAMANDGGFTYQPNAGFAGVDSFTYRASDGDQDDEATVVISVTATNLPPVSSDDAYATPQDTLLTVAAPGILANDSDPEGHSLKISLQSKPANGVLALTTGGGFTYAPNAGFTGTDSFTYTVTDGKSSSGVATVQITVNAVNKPPVANNDSFATPQDTLLTVTGPGLLANDDDPEGQPLTTTIVTQPANGSMGLAFGGGFIYQPNPGFSGTDSFTYTVSDGQLASNVATVTIAVSATNTAPVANNDAYATPQDTLLTVTTPGLLANDSDPEGDTLKISLQSQPASGVLALTTGGGFTYTPNAGFSGTDSFTYTVTDGKLSSNTATVNIAISATNNPPVANNDTYATPQDTLLTVAAPGLLVNDSDPEGQALKISIASQPANGALALTTGGGFTYTPKAGFSGTDSFTYTVTDGKLVSNVATVQIAVSATNLPPVANDDAYATPQDTLLTVAAPGILANDSDPEGHSLKISLQSQPANGVLALTTGGGFTYTPNAGFSGADSFTYTVTDGKLGSNVATVALTVTAVAQNRPPVAVDDAYATPQDKVLTVAAPGILTNDSDPEGQALTATIATQPTNGHLVPVVGGGFSYTPSAGFSGTDSFTYTVSDGQLDSNTATVTITVTPVATNQPPVAADDGPYAVLEGTTLTVPPPGILANDSDPEGHALTVTVVTQPAHGHLSVSNGGFSYTPDAGFTGTDTFSYSVSDGVLDSNVATVTIEVTPAPVQPVTPYVAVPTLDRYGLLALALLLLGIVLFNRRMFA